MDNSDSDDYELMPSHELDDLRHEVASIKKNSMAEGDKARMLIESMDRLTGSINKFVSVLNDAQKDIIDEYQASKPTEKLNQLLDQSETIAKALIAMNENLTNTSNSKNQPAPATPATSNDYSYQAYTSSAGQPYASTQQYPAQNQGYTPTQQYSVPNQGYAAPQPFTTANQGNSSPQPFNPAGQSFTPSINQNFNSPNTYSQASPFNSMPPMSQQNAGPMNNSRNVLPIPSPSGNQNFGPASMNQQQMSYGQSMSMDSSTSIPDVFPPMEEIPPLDGPLPSAPKKKFLGIM